ncbi:MAG: chemotaxis protein CheR [Spirochaetales bacterium]|nr:chemotaxis protein CheR [Spirochaetales bacterium]
MATVANKIRKRTTSALAREEELLEQIDFKMVTFSLAGKDYGIDIMKIKEIARFVHFTYVPNTPPYVRGVYNLRGEIISIIDLRGMFNLPHEENERGEEEAGLILRLESNLIGVVVDKIDKVIGINSGSIQPPHPIFGDINIKYISGVVENGGRLYIILDVEKILAKKEEISEKGKIFPPLGLDSSSDIGQKKLEGSIEFKEKAHTDSSKSTGQNSAVDNDSLNLEFITESLLALEGFHVSLLNLDWIQSRYEEWKKERPAGAYQLATKQDSTSFLRPFSSPFTGGLWSKDYAEKLAAALPPDLGKQLHVWNPGCGRGYETFSLAVVLRKKYPNSIIKVWASDKDLLSVSAAPNLVFSPGEVPEWLREFMVEGKNGLFFSPAVKDMVMFEYHDIMNSHSMPPVQFTFARDLFSYLPIDYVKTMIRDLHDRYKGPGYICLGHNEKGTIEFGLEEITNQPLKICKIVG